MRLLITLVLCLHLLTPIAVHAQATMRDPLSYSLAEYGLMQFAGSPENKAACAPAFERGVAYT